MFMTPWVMGLPDAAGAVSLDASVMDHDGDAGSCLRAAMLKWHRSRGGSWSGRRTCC